MPTEDLVRVYRGLPRLGATREQRIIRLIGQVAQVIGPDFNPRSLPLGFLESSFKVSFGV